MNATFERSLATLQEEIQSNASVEEESVTSYIRFGSEGQNEFMCEHLHSRVNDEQRVQSISQRTTENVSVFIEDVKNEPVCGPNFVESSVVDNGIESYASAGGPLNLDRTSDPQFGNIAIQNATDVVFGSRTVYYGPVTIQQVVAKANVAEQTDTRINDNDVHLAETLNQSVVTTDTGGSLRIVSRKEWFAREPLCDLIPMILPAKRVIIAHTASAIGMTQRECVRLIRDFQDYHIEEKDWGDISYNFLVGGDGSVYVGRGWDYVGTHSRMFNEGSICIAFIGQFCRMIPPERSLIAAQQLIEDGVKMKKLTEDYKLYGHRQLIPTISPGKALYNNIKTWSHWSEDVIPPD